MEKTFDRVLSTKGKIIRTVALLTFGFLAFSGCATNKINTEISDFSQYSSPVEVFRAALSPDTIAPLNSGETVISKTYYIYGPENSKDQTNRIVNLSKNYCEYKNYDFQGNLHSWIGIEGDFKCQTDNGETFFSAVINNVKAAELVQTGKTIETSIQITIPNP